MLSEAAYVDVTPDRRLLEGGACCCQVLCSKTDSVICADAVPVLALRRSPCVTLSLFSHFASLGLSSRATK